MAMQDPPDFFRTDVYIRIGFRRVHVSELLSVSGRPVVTVMHSADSLTRSDAISSDRGSSASRRSLRQSKMGSILVVIADILRDQPLQMPFVHGNHVIQQIATACGILGFRFLS